MLLKKLFPLFQSFKSKQLVRSQAIRETHSPPRALSPAQPPTVTISTSVTNLVSAGNTSPSIGHTAPNVGNTTPSVGAAYVSSVIIENGTSVDKGGSNITTVGNSSTSIVDSSASVGNLSASAANSTASLGNSSASTPNSSAGAVNSSASTVLWSASTEPSMPDAGSPSVVNSGATSDKASNERTVSVSDDSSHVSVRCSDVVISSDVKHSDSDEFKKKLPVEIQVSVPCCFICFE